MIIFDCCLSKTRCNDIPTGATRRSQAMSIASNPLSIKNKQIQEFVSLVGGKGYSFCPSTFTDRFSRKDTFNQTQLFALYFDSLSSFNKDCNNNFSFDDMKQRAEQYHLPILFAYDVFSGYSFQDNHHMFCIVFLNDIPITSLRAAETIQRALRTIFPEADKEHGSVIDLYFGGNEVLYYNQTMPTINADIAILSVYRFLWEQYGNNYKRKMISFAEDTGILLDDKNRPVVTFAEELRDNSDFDVDSNENPARILIEENDKNSPKPTIYRKDGSGEKLSRLTFTIHLQDDPHLEGVDPSTTVNRSKVHQLYRSDTLKAISFNCELYQELESISSERELSYQELDLKKLKKKLYARDSLYAKIKKILKKSENHEFFFVDEIDYNDSYDDIDTKINIRALCEGTHFYFREDSDHDCGDIVFAKRPDLPEGVKFIMLSATANESICNICFGEENARFYNCKEAILTGTLNQYYDRPMSRAYLDRHLEVMEQIKEWTGFEHTITFKKYADYCTDNMYYGNCVGCDVLKGENIDVIGTPHQADWVYKLFAFTFGFDIDDDLNPRSTVTNSGYRFHFATFDNEILRMIQFYIIETDLEQAIGRARLLRCDATVNLFSNFPLRQAILKESEYDKEGQDS